MKRTKVFDIETGPLPEAELLAMVPPFDPNDVKVGNIKNPDLIAAKIEESRINHTKNFVDRAALDPLTGRVLAIGMVDGDQITILDSDDEKELLSSFWKETQYGFDYTFHNMIGFNIYAFDLPFLIRRSWKHEVRVPNGVRTIRNWGPDWVDLRIEWQLGNRDHHGSLDSIAKHLGVGQKSGSGADFASLWASDRPKALEYLSNDLKLTCAVYERIRSFL